MMQMDLMVIKYVESDQTLAVYVTAWLPHCSAPPHNHGTWAISAGVVSSETHTFWKRIDDGNKPNYAMIVEQDQFVCSPGKVIFMESEQIHSVMNESEESKIASELIIFILPLIPKLKQKIGAEGQEWYLEDEWRLYQITYNKNINSDFDFKNMLSSPRNEGYSEIKFGQKNICEIWLGRNCEKESRQVELLLSKYGFNCTIVRREKLALI